MAMVGYHGIMTTAASTRWAVRCVLVLLFLIAMPPAAAWNSLRQGPRGVCKWRVFSPQCQIPPKCFFHESSDEDSQLAVSDIPAINAKMQASPVTFTQDAIAAAQKLPPIQFARLTPMVQPVDRLTGQSIMELMPAKTTTQMRLEVNGGGVVTAMCTDRAPLFVAFSSMGAKEPQKGNGELDEGGETTTPTADGTDPLPRHNVYEVMQIQFYNGMLHEWPPTNAYPASNSLDIEIHLREAKVNYKYADSTVYQSICTDSLRTRQVTDLIVSLPVEAGAGRSYSSSLLTMLLGNLTRVASQLLKGSSYDLDLGMTVPLISTQSSAERMEFPFIHYVGSIAQPPCTPKVPRLQLLNSIAVSSNALMALKRIAKNQQNANGGLRYPLLPSTTLSSSSLIISNTLFETIDDVPTDELIASSSSDGLKGGRKNLKGERDEQDDKNDIKFYRDAIPVLVTINIILLSYLLLLLFARLEWLDWPTALGGLNHPVQFYTRAYEEMEALKAAGLRVPQTTPAPDTHDNSAADAKEEDREEDVASHVATDVLSTVQ